MSFPELLLRAFSPLSPGQPVQDHGNGCRAALMILWLATGRQTQEAIMFTTTAANGALLPSRDQPGKCASLRFDPFAKPSVNDRYLAQSGRLGVHGGRSNHCVACGDPPGKRTPKAGQGRARCLGPSRVRTARKTRRIPPVSLNACPAGKKQCLADTLEHAVGCSGRNDVRPQVRPWLRSKDGR